MQVTACTTFHSSVPTLSTDKCVSDRLQLPVYRCLLDCSRSTTRSGIWQPDSSSSSPSSPESSESPPRLPACKTSPMGVRPTYYQLQPPPSSLGASLFWPWGKQDFIPEVAADATTFLSPSSLKFAGWHAKRSPSVGGARAWYVASFSSGQSRCSICLSILHASLPSNMFDRGRWKRSRSS